MAKKETYPVARSMAARLDAIQQGLADGANALRHVREIALPELTDGPLKSKISGIVADAERSMETSKRAIYGDEE